MFSWTEHRLLEIIHKLIQYTINMSSAIDINNIEQLKKCSALLTATPQKADEILARFPIHQIEEIHQFNDEVVTELTTIFNFFVIYCHPLQNAMIPVLKYYPLILQRLTNRGFTEDSNYEVLIQILNGLHTIFQQEEYHDRLSEVLGKDLLHSLDKIMDCPHTPPETLQTGVSIFIECLKYESSGLINLEAAKHCSVMWNLAHVLPIDALLELIDAFFKYANVEHLPSVSYIYKSVVAAVELLSKDDDKVVKKILVCIVNTYKRSKTPGVLNALTAQLKTVNFPKCLNNFLSEEKAKANYPVVSEALYYFINVEFEDAPFHSQHGNLREILNKLDVKTIFQPNIEDPFKSDIDYVLMYLDIVSLKKRERCPHLIDHMVTLYGEKLPSNPAVLKSILLIFAVNVDYEMSPEVRSFMSNLLLFLQHREDSLQNYITHHVALLTLLLQRGSKLLRPRVAAMWLRGPDHILGQLFRYFKNANDSKLLIEVIYKHIDPKTKHDALDMFHMCSPDEKSLVPLLLLRPSISIDTYECILKCTPSEWTLYKPDHPNYDSELTMIYALAKRLIDILSREEFEISEGAKISTMSHLYSLCTELNRTTMAECFLKEKLVQFLLEFTKSKSQEQAIIAYKFLYLIATAQVFLQITNMDSIQIVPSAFRHGDELIKEATKFYEYILNTSFGIKSFISVDSNRLALYYNLMEVLISQAGDVVYPLLVLLLENYEECVTSAINISAIRLHCRDACTNVNFIRYLCLWCQLAPKYKYMPIPMKVILPFVRHLDIIQYQDADYAVLRKVKNHPDICIYD